MKNFILIFLIFFSFDSMSQDDPIPIKTVSEYRDNDDYDHVYNAGLGWREGTSITDEDVISLTVTNDNTIPDGYVKLMLSKTSNVSWWKGVKCEKDPYCLGGGEIILQVWDNGDAGRGERVKMDGPQTFVAPLKLFQKSKLQLWKAKGLGEFKNLYNLIPNNDWEAGKAYHFKWIADCDWNCGNQEFNQ